MHSTVVGSCREEELTSSRGDIPTLTLIKIFSIATNNLLRKTFIWLPKAS